MNPFERAMGLGKNEPGKPAHQQKPRSSRPARRTFKSLRQEIAKLKAERNMLLDIVKHAAKI